MLIRLVCAFFFTLLAVSIIWAAGTAPLWESFALVTANPWGAVALIDLYAGFVAMALVIGVVDGPRVGFVAFIALCVLGNLVSLAWLAFRGYRRLMSRLA